ncbi:peptidase [Bacillus manliponensis]|uniref:peptidase n=1 Tax=Bacillus manliponensis TaxID=574376 RepID=UPI003517493F
MGILTLNEIILEKNRIDFFFNIEGGLKKYFRKQNQMFLEYNHSISGVPNSILCIPFISNIMPLIWITNSTIVIDELDKSFYNCLNDIREAYQKMFPSIEFRGRIVANRLIDNTYTPQVEAATLFSGGLDALTTFIRIQDKKPMLITEYGWYKEDIESNQVWDADKENAIQFAKVHNLENIFIQSNYGTFILAEKVDQDFSKKLGDSWWHGLHHGLAIISAAIPIACKLKIGCIYIASSNSPAYQVSCASDPTVDNQIRYASGRVFHDAYELNRQDKIKVVVDYYLSSQEDVNIRVCFKKEENCCKCEKCLRTIMGIIAEGQNPNDYGFYIPGNLTTYIQKSMDEEVKFFTDTFIIMYWKIIQRRMRENQERVIYKDLLQWFLNYDFTVQRKRALLKYRVTQFFPILKRKIHTNLSKIFTQQN